MVFFMLQLRKKTMQLELYETYSKKLFKDIEVPKASAFFQNRKKMNSNLFKEIIDSMNNDYYVNFAEEVKLFKGFRLLAIDGSKLTLPSTKELEEKYGKAKNQHEEGLAAGHISCLYDIENEMVIDVVLGSYKANERLQAKEHLEYCNSNDLIIFDRGYPSVELISELEKR